MKEDGMCGMFGIGRGRWTSGISKRVMRSPRFGLKNVGWGFSK